MFAELSLELARAWRQHQFMVGPLKQEEQAIFVEPLEEMLSCDDLSLILSWMTTGASQSTLHIQRPLLPNRVAFSIGVC